MPPEVTRVDVDLGARAYPIWIGTGLLGDAARLRDTLAGRTALVLTDDNVAPLYAETLIEGAAGAAECTLHVLPHGEAGKNLGAVESVLDALVAAGAQRDAVLVALGGGVVGDIGGFAAACYMRGIDFLQVPTTLLAQVDSSVGGKTGVNHPRGKNLIGAFHQPRAVLIDVATLTTLADREFAAGVAETIKYGMIDRPDFFAWIETHAGALADRDGATLIEAIRQACEAKADVVRQDEREKGARALLNLGHTFGHAIETETDYRRFLHGEAVAIGMALAADLALRLGRSDPDVPDRLRRLLTRFGLPVMLPPELAPEALWAHMQLDKKNRAGRVRLIVPEGIGGSVIDDGVDASDVLAVLAAGRAGA